MVDLALAKAHLRADGTAEDALIQSYLDAAAAHIEGATGKLLTRRSITQPVARFEMASDRTGTYIALWWGPAPAFSGDDDELAYVDAAGAPQAVVNPRLVGDRLYAPVAGWPTNSDATPIAATYTAGFATVPADLIQVHLMLVAHWWNQREAVALAATVAEVPLGVEAILMRHRTIRI